MGSRLVLLTVQAAFVSLVVVASKSASTGNPGMNRISKKNPIVVIPSIVMVVAVCVGPGGSKGAELPIRSDTFEGIKAGAETNVATVQLCWCPAGKFIMGSPRHELERRPGEDQVE